MGLYAKVRDELPDEFSIFQLMAVLEMDETDFHEARNILKQWTKINGGLIKRISKNMYRKIK
ncbi:MAG: hypothetical protein ACTSXF_11905 [Promethearchaeota archaeon]